MGTKNFGDYNNLQQELDNAKDTLVILNDNIKRIIGRSPKVARDSRPTEAKRCDSENPIKKFSQEYSSSRRKVKSVFKRLSSPTGRSNEGEPRPRLTSRVIKELPSRQEIVAAQSADSESRARNRRMFGSLLGTLHKFCQEESRLKQKEEKKAQIERKLEEQEILERESLKKERETLFIDRKRKQTEIKCLESKIRRIKDYETWETSTLYLKNFIKTETSPGIYYRPKRLTKKTEKLLYECSIDIDKALKRKKNDFHVNLLKLEEKFEFNELDASDGSSNDFNKTPDLLDSSRVKQYSLSSSICNVEKYDPDSKENKIRYSGEQMLSSSVVIINH